MNPDLSSARNGSFQVLFLAPYPGAKTANHSYEKIIEEIANRSSVKAPFSRSPIKYLHIPNPERMTEVLKAIGL